MPTTQPDPSSLNQTFPRVAGSYQTASATLHTDTRGVARKGDESDRSERRWMIVDHDISD